MSDPRSLVLAFAETFDSLPAEQKREFEEVSRRIVRGMSGKRAFFRTPEAIALEGFSLGFVLGAALGSRPDVEPIQDDHGARETSSPWSLVSWTS